MAELIVLGGCVIVLGVVIVLAGAGVISASEGTIASLINLVVIVFAGRRRGPGGPDDPKAPTGRARKRSPLRDTTLLVIAGLLAILAAGCGPITATIARAEIHGQGTAGGRLVVSADGRVVCTVHAARVALAVDAATAERVCRAYVDRCVWTVAP